MSATAGVALALLAAAALLPVIARRAGALAAGTGAVLLVVVGLTAALGGSQAHIALGSWFGFGPAALRVDGLSGLFLALTGLAGVAVSLAYFERLPGRGVCSLLGTLLFAMTIAITADNAFIFLAAWEGLTVTLYLLTSAERGREGTLVVGYFTGTMNKLGGAALLAAFGLLYGHTGSFSFAAWAHAAPAMSSVTRGVVFALLLVGFGTKVGMVPFQGWLPVGHAAAPGASSATLSGIAVNAGFYGLWRLVFDTLRPASLWWGETVLVLGGLTALLGILYAIAQGDIKRFLGFSTIEQSGITLIGFGVALIGLATRDPKLAGAGLLAATLNVVMHAIAKTLAFLCAARIDHAAGTRELGRLGGLARSLPRTAVPFTIAGLTLAAMPPFGGFVSEWFTFEALLQGFRLHTATATLFMALAAALLALTTGLALLAFAKLIGFTLLSADRADRKVREVDGRGLGVAALGVVAVTLGAVAPWEIQLLVRGMRITLGFDAGTQALSHPLVLGPVYAKFSVLAPTWLTLVLVSATIVVAALVRVALRPAVRRAPVWVSGTLAPPSVVQYTAAAYSNPIRVVLRGPYGYTRKVTAHQAGRSPLTETLVVETRIVLAIERFVYRPVVSGALWLSTQARRLQSGRLGWYLLYMLAALILILALIPVLRH
jgi:hydrogenase-4 component B